MFSRSYSPYPGLMTETTTGLLKLSDEYGAHNYHPLPVVAAEAEGAWVTDVEGRRYLDMLAAYSALNFGHGHPRLVAAAQRQLERLTLVSRAFQHDQFGPFCAELADLAGMDVVLPMNTGAEAVETAIKVARKWGYPVKGVPAGQALMIADEIQSGLGRTGYTFACAAEGVVPDAYLLGKALGGGIVPVSAMVSTWPVLGVLHPGQHGSTFGGNPLACAVGREVVAMLRTGEYQARARVLGDRMHARLAALPSSEVASVRGRGLWAGLEFASLPGRGVGARLAARGVPARATPGDRARVVR